MPMVVQVCNGALPYNTHPHLQSIIVSSTEDCNIVHAVQVISLAWDYTDATVKGLGWGLGAGGWVVECAPSVEIDSQTLMFVDLSNMISPLEDYTILTVTWATCWHRVSRRCSNILSTNNMCGSKSWYVRRVKLCFCILKSIICTWRKYITDKYSYNYKPCLHAITNSAILYNISLTDDFTYLLEQ